LVAESCAAGHERRVYTYYLSSFIILAPCSESGRRIVPVVITVNTWMLFLGIKVLYELRDHATSEGSLGSTDLHGVATRYPANQSLSSGEIPACSWTPVIPQHYTRITWYTNRPMATADWEGGLLKRSTSAKLEPSPFKFRVYFVPCRPHDSYSLGSLRTRDEL